MKRNLGDKLCLEWLFIVTHPVPLTHSRRQTRLILLFYSPVFLNISYSQVEAVEVPWWSKNFLKLKGKTNNKNKK